MEKIYTRTLGPSRAFELFKEGKIIPKFRRNNSDCNDFESGSHTFWFPAKVYFDGWEHIVVAETDWLPHSLWGKGYYLTSEDRIITDEVICEKEVIPTNIYALDGWDRQALSLSEKYGYEFVMWLGSLPVFDGPSHIDHFNQNQTNKENYNE